MKRRSTLLIIREMQIKSQWGITLHWSEWLIIKRSTNSRKGVNKRECKCVGGNVNWCSHYGELYGVSFKKIWRQNYHCCVQLFSHFQLFVTPWTAACPVSLSFTISWSLLKLMSIELVMPWNHLILCHPCLLLPLIFPTSYCCCCC